jgi:hypothetical protein
LRGFDRDVWFRRQSEYDVEGMSQISQAEVEVVSKPYRPAKWRDQVAGSPLGDRHQTTP